MPCSTSQGQELREVIRKVTKGVMTPPVMPERCSNNCTLNADGSLLCNAAAHEVVEVDGFVFKRKRRTLPGDSAGCAEPAKRAREDDNLSVTCSSGEASVQPPAGPAPHTEVLCSLRHD